ncbi:MAG: hypothetical protein HY697_03380 [Deltaproteobacteria bacterium]|nr:hypothetical protein [Deltaproteobacteria bacterium]
MVEVTGSEMPILASPATNDTRWLVLHAGIPTCKFSFTTVGSGPNERIRLEDYLQTIQVYLVSALNLLHPAAGSDLTACPPSPPRPG